MRTIHGRTRSRRPWEAVVAGAAVAMAIAAVSGYAGYSSWSGAPGGSYTGDSTAYPGYEAPWYSYPGSYPPANTSNVTTDVAIDNRVEVYYVGPNGQLVNCQCLPEAGLIDFEVKQGATVDVGIGVGQH